MKVVVLTGGFATRLRPLTLTRPKPLLPILDKSLLDWILTGLASSGLKDVILSVRYLSNMIKGKYGDGSAYGLSINYAEEVKPLGDAGPIKLINDKFGLNETFLVVYGDVFTNIDYRKVIEFHKKKGGLATLVVTPVDDPSRYGVAVLDKNGKVVDFVEKPPKEQAKSNLVNAGVYVFESEAIKYFPDKPSKLSRDVIPKMVEDGVIYGYEHKGIWKDIGVPADYLKANYDALLHYHPKGFISNKSNIKEAEILQPSFIGDNVTINKNSRIGPFSIIGSGCSIGPSTRVFRSVLLNHTTIEGSALIESSVVGEKCYIGKWVRVSEGTVLGDEVVLKDEIFIARNTIILPYKEVTSNIEKEGMIVL